MKNIKFFQTNNNIKITNILQEHKIELNKEKYIINGDNHCGYVFFKIIKKKLEIQLK